MKLPDWLRSWAGLLVVVSCAGLTSAEPLELQWEDHRPIGADFLCSAAMGIEKNPRGWFNDRNLDVTTAAGRADFRSGLLARAETVIRYCRNVDAQGVIVWDLEGQEFPHATSYIGDPRALPKLAPEMDAAADEMFQKYRDAGLRVGITIRPSRIIPVEGQPGKWGHNQFGGVIDELADKIAYATNRWQCTLFYIDSNVWWSWSEAAQRAVHRLINAAETSELARRFPTVLLIPEHESTEHWAISIPYNELRGGFAGTPANVRAKYPAARSLIYPSDDRKLVTARLPELVANVVQGDMLFFRAWYSDPVSHDVKAIYRQAAAQRRAQRPPLDVARPGKEPEPAERWARAETAQRLTAVVGDRWTLLWHTQHPDNFGSYERVLRARDELREIYRLGHADYQKAARFFLEVALGGLELEAMSAQDTPEVRAQIETYEKAAAAAKGKTITFQQRVDLENQRKAKDQAAAILDKLNLYRAGLPDYFAKGQKLKTAADAQP